MICGEEWWKGSNIEKWGGARRARWCARGGGRASEAGWGERRTVNRRAGRWLRLVIEIDVSEQAYPEIHVL